MNYDQSFIGGKLGVDGIKVITQTLREFWNVFQHFVNIVPQASYSYTAQTM